MRGESSLVGHPDENWVIATSGSIANEPDIIG